MPDFLDMVMKVLRDARTSRRTFPTVVTEEELEFLKQRTPSMADWYDRNTLTYEFMGTNVEPTLIERLNKRHGKNQAESPTPNRADRRDLRHRKTR